ncbi:MAG: enoyl-CoA hydratase-related protein [Pseudomonadota bacterium]
MSLADRRFETLSLEIDDRGVARLFLARPERRNALNEAMIRELTRAARALAEDASVRVAVLSGAGDAFCAGGDLAWFAESAQKDRGGRLADSLLLADLFEALNSLPKPLIARVNGAAFGGGVGLIATCDAAVGLAGARLALSEVRLGLAPANIAPYVIAKIGAAAARATMLSGAPFDAAEALRIGLLQSVAETETALDAACDALVEAHLGAAPQAAAATKALIAEIAAALPKSGPAGLKDLTAAALAEIWDSEDAKAGLSAFLEKRPPPWRGDTR